MPPPCSATSFLSRTSTFLLSSCRSSGLMTRSLGLFDPASPELLAGLWRPSAPLAEADVLVLGDEGLSVGFRWRTGAEGKFFRLSTASTVLRKRRKSAWARSRVELRSIVLESSFTMKRSVPLVRHSTTNEMGCRRDYHISAPRQNASSAP